MKITLSPCRSDDPLSLSVSGDVLTINGDQLDLTVIPEGATISDQAVASPWVVGPISRIGGQIEVMITLPIPANAPDHMCFPDPIICTDGPVALPQVEAAL